MFLTRYNTESVDLFFKIRDVIDYPFCFFCSLLKQQNKCVLYEGFYLKMIYLNTKSIF